MNFLDFDELGGMPFTQNRLKFMQDANLGAFGALAKLCGDKVIVTGVVVTGSNVSSGWISYNGELIEFVGGAMGPQVVISQTSVPFTYANAAVHDVQFTRTAMCGVIGAFPFSDLVPLLQLQNVWKKDDVRMSYKSNAYIAANFNVNGLGINAEIGWAIINNVLPTTAGKVFANRDATDTDYDTAGKTGGAKTKTLQPSEQGSLDFGGQGDDGDGDTGTFGSFKNIIINGVNVAAPLLGTASANVRLKNDAAPFDNRQPFFTMLHLIKL